MSWTGIYHVADLPLTVSCGGAIAVWLLAGGERRAAARWLLAFGLALGLVGVSKIAHLGWATSIPALHFEALSGHATGFAAAFPTLCHLLARRKQAPARRLAAIGSLAATAAVAIALVRARQHAPAEVAAGCLVGLAAYLATVRLLPPRSSRHGGGAVVCSVLAFALCASFTATAPVGYWMIKVALAVSGNSRPHPWALRSDLPTKLDRRQACIVPPPFDVRGNAKASSTTSRPIHF